MKVSRRKGRLRLQLDRVEVALLSRLLDDLDEVLSGDSSEPDTVLARLYPAAYRDDADAEAEFRTLTEAGLRSDRADRIEACRAELAQGGAIDLPDPDAGQRWIKVLNDLRLAAGTRLGITEDDQPDFDPDDPAQGPRVAYYWLTAVQDALVRALMR
ncbi:MAG TPA: DUF2017 family protein [Jatrophihabitans sp.]|nr:DUF2017 family protein [Jatrophihabitans sp.]